MCDVAREMRWLLVRTLCWCLLLVLSAGLTAGQAPWRQDVEVRDGARVLTMPWAGGLNAPQVSAANWNGDALSDLLVHDRLGEVTLPLIASGAGAYRWAPELAKLPPYRPARWVLLQDADGDGDQDLWCDTTGGVQLWIRTATGWDKRYPQLFSRFISGSGPISVAVFVGPADYPAVRDVDGDGDMDLLAWNPTGGVLLNYFKNFAVEELGRADTIHFAQASECWGHFIEGFDFTSNLYTINLNYTVCVPRELKREHEGGAVLALNLNADTLTDVIVADAGVPYVYALTNGGTRRFANITTAEGFYPAVKPILIDGGPALFYADATGDGVPDLLAAPNDPTAGPDTASLWLYPNTGTSNLPNWAFARENALQREMIDLGTGSAPCLADVTGDGLEDLIVGVGKRWINGAWQGGKLVLYRNVGTATRPSFARTDNDFLGLAALQRQEWVPAAADMDGDGDIDLVLGYFTASALNTLLYYRNDTPRGGAIRFVQANADFGGMGALGLFALAPYLADLDADGDIDLVVGHSTGAVVLAKNEGTARSALFTTRIENWGGVNVGGPENSFVGFARPLIADVTDDGQQDLLVGNANGSIRLYRNISNQPGAVFASSGNWQNADVGLRSGLGAARLHSDDSLTVVVGNQRGGLQLLKARGRTYTEPGPEPGVVALLWPNPAEGRANLLAPAGASVRVVDMLGRQLLVTRLPVSGEGLEIDVSTWAVGVYIVLVESAEVNERLRLVVANRTQ
jgi:hypothetical protein